VTDESDSRWSECHREPGEDENPDDDWRVYSGRRRRAARFLPGSARSGSSALIQLRLTLSVKPERLGAFSSAKRVSLNLPLWRIWTIALFMRVRRQVRRQTAVARLWRNWRN
jgi:hypothetical protein